MIVVGGGEWERGGFGGFGGRERRTAQEDLWEVIA